MLKVKRIYEKPMKSDGIRILVDRLWPRGISKRQAKIDLWLKDVAPSNALRKWFGHDPKRWPQFKKRYFQELRKNEDSLETLRKSIQGKSATLLYGAKDGKCNNAVALRLYVRRFK